VIPASGDPIIVTPFFEKPSVEESLGVPAEIRTWNEDEEPLKLVADFIRERGLATARIGMEETNRYFILDRLNQQLPSAKVVSANPVVRGCRMIKTDAELALMQAASDITLAAFAYTWPQLKAGMTVADIGAGGGWFTVRLARRVGPHGRVYAVDVQRLMIEAIQRRVQREGFQNVVVPVLGDYDDPKLPPDARPDAVLIVDAFHEMADPVVMLRNVARTLKPHARIGIIDYREGDGGPGPDAAERVPPSIVVAQAANAGLKLVEEHKFLPYQYFLIFGK